MVRRFLAKATGISAVQMDRLIRQWRESGRIEDRRGGNRGRPFERRYTGVDIRLLAEVDEAFGQMSGLATCELLRRQHEVFGDERFERLAGISNSHVYNLRASKTYVTAHGVDEDACGDGGHRRCARRRTRRGSRGTCAWTRSTRATGGVKGLYLVNLVDEVTQYEYVGAVRGISERFLVPLLEAVLSLFPFTVAAFHADNGSEYINHRVAGC